MCFDIVEICTIVVAVLAFIVTIWQGWETRKHNRLSVKPLIKFGTSHDRNAREACYSYKNVGLGTAIIKVFSIYIDGIPLESLIYKNIIDSLSNIGLYNSSDNESEIYVTIPHKEEELSANETQEVIRYTLNTDLSDFEIIKASKRINIVIKYESVYGESFDCELNRDLKNEK